MAHTKGGVGLCRVLGEGSIGSAAAKALHCNGVAHGSRGRCLWLGHRNIACPAGLQPLQANIERSPMPDPFSSPNQVRESLRDQGYVCSPEIATITYLSDQLDKPLLIEGPAGVGKTELAKVVAAATGRELIRLQCYEGLDETKALYEWEYAKQLLYTQLLRDKLQEVLASTGSLAESADRIAAEENVFFSMRFLLQRPLLKALLSPEPVVLLIDEIDRADAEFEAFLLEILSDFQISVPELGTLTARVQPLVFLTSNNTRELSEALKRRCLYLFLNYPELEQEIAVVNLKVPELDGALTRQAVEMVQGLRNLDLRKHPSISETLDWARTLVVLNADRLDSGLVSDTLNVLLKHERDLKRVQQRLEPMSGDGPEYQGPEDEDDHARYL